MDEKWIHHLQSQKKHQPNGDGRVKAGQSIPKYNSQQARSWLLCFRTPREFDFELSSKGSNDKQRLLYGTIGLIA